METTVIFDLDGKAELIEGFFPQGLFDAVKESVDWRQYSGTLFGKKVRYPRLNAYYGDRPYEYSGTRHEPQAFPSAIEEMRKRVESHTRFHINAALLNYYRQGSDYLGWHSDGEKSLDTSLIATLSLGAARVFKFRYKKDKSVVKSLNLADGSLLLMRDCQTHWHHQVPKTSQRIGERISITFRRML